MTEGKSAIIPQRRQMTVLFCDLVGSTQLSGRLDAEDMQEIIINFFMHCTALIEHAGGFIARYMGDGFLAYFGHEIVMENDAERAARAALSIISSVADLSVSADEQIAVRIGIATGLVIMGTTIGTGMSSEHLIVGDTANIAARLQTLAQANQIVVNETTKQLVERHFDFQKLPGAALRGLSPDITTYQLLGIQQDRGTGPRRARMPTSPLIGRDDELDQILAVWRECKSGECRIIGIVGEAGIGKSRLLEEAVFCISKEAPLSLSLRGEQMFQNSPFHAVAKLLNRVIPELAESSVSDIPALETALKRGNIGSKRTLSLLADVMGLPQSSSYPPLNETAEMRRQQTMAVLVDWLRRIAGKRPILLVIEDLHWLDPSTKELLQAVLDGCADLSLTILFTSRDGADNLKPNASSMRMIPLRPLDPSTTARLLDAALIGIPADSAALIVERSGGIPLFAVELARHIASNGQNEQKREIPATLADLLMARLSQAGHAMKLAQQIAVLGMEATQAQLAEISGIEAGPLAQYCDTLIECGIVSLTAKNEVLTFTFNHALVRDAAYDALLKRQRLQLHKRAATMLAGGKTEEPTCRPEILAYHWMRADELPNALIAWKQAGQQATNRRAYVEAQRAFEQAIGVLITFPYSTERDADELVLQSKLGATLQITKGYSSPMAAAATARAQMLAQMAGDVENQFGNYVGAWMGASSAGEYRRASEVVERLLPLAQAAGTKSTLGVAHMIQMTSLYRIGELVEAENAFLTGEGYFYSKDFEQHPGSVAQTFGNAALIGWILGKKVEARRRLKVILDQSVEAPNPFEQAFAGSMAATILQLMGRYGAAAKMAESTLCIASENGFPQFVATAQIIAGCAGAQLGELESGIALIRQGIAAMATTRSRAGISMYQTWLAEALAAQGKWDEAAVEVELAFTSNPEERFFLPEAMRIKAGIEQGRGAVRSAESLLIDALALSRAMGAQQFYNLIIRDMGVLPKSSPQS